MEIVIIALLVVVIILQVMVISKNKSNAGEGEKTISAIKELKKEQDDLKTGVLKEISEGQMKNQNFFFEHISGLKTDVMKELSEGQNVSKNLIQENLDKMQKQMVNSLVENANQQSKTQEVIMKSLVSIQESTEKRLAENADNVNKTITEGQVSNKTMIQENLDKMQKQMVNSLVENANQQSKTQEVIMKSLVSIQESTEKRLAENADNVNKTIMEGLKNVQQASDAKLSEIQKNVDDKLDKSLNERIDQSFKQVGERLESLYKSLGELKSLESGVSNLNRTLTNVKARGIYGEMALENILANILDKSQYEKNVATRPKSAERVEFAIKIPDKENKGFIYLPVDSKFPSDIYGRVLEASENADAPMLKEAINELKARIRKEAMTIRDKYVAPPDTTDFAIMFLPTEGLYSEVIRIDGLVEECQEKYKIVISGPTTLTAILNSLSVGFRYLTVNKKSEEIMKLLGNFKTQFAKFSDLISKTQTKISAAQAEAENLKKRSDMIQKKLDKVEAVEYEEPLSIGEMTEDLLDV